MGKPCYPNMPHKTEGVKYEQKILPVFEQERMSIPVFESNEEKKVLKKKKVEPKLR